MTDLEKVIRASIEEVGATPNSVLSQTDTVIVTFTTDIEAMKVTGAFRMDMDDGVKAAKMSTRFSICGESDPYDEDLGISIAIGRVMKVHEHDAAIAGSIPAGSSIETYLENRIEQLENALRFRTLALDNLEQFKQSTYKDISDGLEGFK